MSGKQGSILYVGLDPSRYPVKNIFHFPLIRVTPAPLEQILPVFEKWDQFSHILFTSRTTVTILKSHLDQLKLSWDKKKLIAIGSATAESLEKVDYVAKVESSEGVVALLEGLQIPFLLYPRSMLARPVIRNYLIEKGITFVSMDLYTTQPHCTPPLPSLSDFEEIVFTSPSTVDAFIFFYGNLPRDKKLSCIGATTQKYVTKCLEMFYGGR